MELSVSFYFRRSFGSCLSDGGCFFIIEKLDALDLLFRAEEYSLPFYWFQQDFATVLFHLINRFSYRLLSHS